MNISTISTMFAIMPISYTHALFCGWVIALLAHGLLTYHLPMNSWCYSAIMSNSAISTMIANMPIPHTHGAILPLWVIALLALLLPLC